MIELVKVHYYYHYYFFRYLLFAPYFPLLCSSNSLGGAIEGGWIIESIKSTLLFLFGASES